MVDEQWKHLHHCYEPSPKTPLLAVYERCTRCHGFSLRDIDSIVMKCMLCEEQFCVECNLTDDLFHKIFDRFHVC
jgi:hypothetical protein